MGPFPEPYMETAAALQQDGFAVMRSCMKVEVLKELDNEFQSYESQVLPRKHHSDVRREKHGIAGKDGLPRVVHVSNIHESPYLANLAADPSLLRLASACLGSAGVRPITNTELFDKPPHGNMSTQTPPHQDNYYFKAQKPGIAVWIPLDEVDADTGAVQYVQGSHLRGLRFHDFDFGSEGGFVKTIDDFTDADDDLLRDVGHLDPGDVVVHHGVTIHYAPTNLTSNRRRGLVINYVAEDCANTMADDLYQPALIFHVSGAGRLTAAVQKGWPDRHVLAATCVKCALAGWHGISGGIQNVTRIDGDACELVVEVLDPLLLRQAVIALVKSGHVVRGAGTVEAMPLQLSSSFEVPSSLPKIGSRLPDDYMGVWMLNREEAVPGVAVETADFGIKLQTLSGFYVEFRVPKAILKTRMHDADDCHDSVPLLAQQSASAGLLSCHGMNEEFVVRSCTVAFHPFDGMSHVRRASWNGQDKRALVEASMPGHGCDCKETWLRVDDALGTESAAALELVDDEEGRLGFWIVIGTWFGRVVGRASRGVLTDILCKSLRHAIDIYSEDLGIDAEQAVSDYEATLGRIEAPGVFRIMYDFDPAREGTLLLDDGNLQLRRDAADDNVLIETGSNRRWRSRDLPSKFAAFGQLKRTIV